MESAWPRTIAASRRVILRAGSGSRAFPGARPGRSEANVTSSSGAFAIARRHDVTARLNGSVGASREPVRNLELDGAVMGPVASRPAQAATTPCLLLRSAQRHVHRALRQLRIEAALVEFGHQRSLQFIAFVEKGDAEGKADVAENLGVLRPGNPGARTHHR